MCNSDITVEILEKAIEEETNSKSARTLMEKIKQVSNFKKQSIV